MKDLFAARDELVERFLKPHHPGGVSLASAPRSRRTLRVMSLAVGAGGGATVLDRLAESEEPLIPEVESRVHAIGIGAKHTTGEPAVVVYVTRRLPGHQIPKAAMVPDKIQGVPTEVVQSPMARLAATTGDRKKKIRPLICGISVSRADGPSGTIGAFVRSKRPTDPPGLMLLSNSYVLAPDAGKVAGTVVVQSSADDGEPETIASVLRATRLHRTVPINVDAAIAQIVDRVPHDNVICEIGKVTGSAAPVKDMLVEKHGRTSGHTTGRIAATGITAQVNDPDRHVELTFLNLFRVEALKDDGGSVADLGDSGSLVVEKTTRKAVGLLHAADDLGSFYFAHPIEDVLRELEIELELS